MNKDDFTVFPRNNAEALTMLYLEQLDISDLSPTELAEKYFKVYSEIREYIKRNPKK